MLHEYIEIRGARESNLNNVSLRIPKRKITIFTGVSGSGKSSLVFDTIATEAQRLLNEQGFPPLVNHAGKTVRTLVRQPPARSLRPSASSRFIIVEMRLRPRQPGR